MQKTLKKISEVFVLIWSNILWNVLFCLQASGLNFLFKAASSFIIPKLNGEMKISFVLLIGHVYQID